jgi:pilus assembly protein Flp/PilA
MKDLALKLYIKGKTLAQAVREDESGQDLIEYALVVALIALAATAGMSGVATKIGTAFTNIGTKLNTYTS